jgi:serine/threonine protein kinase/tetratricopeptide (TPR) repeat protein
MIGTTAGPYQVLEKLGEGGMGVVYLAEDSRLGRRVALKFLPAGLGRDDTARRRFLREARSAAAIDHPYVCKIYEVGEAEGRGFLALEYVEGQTLTERLRRGPLAVREALHLAIEMAEALDKAHRTGIVHRDLKPGNVMITAEGHVKVMDFGLAKRFVAGELSPEEATLTALTRAGAAPGTLAYMSPEQVRGQEVDPRSDIFSFGIVLYEMLAGVHPFQKESANRTLAALLAEEPPPLDRSGVTDRLRQTIGTMLAKDPAERYPSFTAVLNELRAPTQETDAARPAPARQRHRLVFALAAAATLGGLWIAVEGVSWRPWHATDTAAPDVAELKVREYESSAATLLENFGDPEALRMSIEAWQKVRELKPGYPPAIAGQAMARSLIAWNSRPDPELVGRAERDAETAMRLDPGLASPYASLTIIYSMRGLFDTAEEMSRRSLELAPRDPWILQLRARFLIDMHGRFDEAEELAGRATEIDPTFSPAWFQLGWARMELQRFDEAEAAFRRAIELRPDLVAGHLGMGIVLDLIGRHEEALEAFDAVLELDPDSTQGLIFEGLTYLDLGRWEEALESFRKGSRQNPDHPLSSYALLDEAVALGRLGRSDEQAIALQAAERLFKAHPQIWFNLHGLAGVAAQRGDDEVALAWLRKAVDAGLKSLNLILTFPATEPLRDDPRFREIVERIGTG